MHSDLDEPMSWVPTNARVRRSSFWLFARRRQHTRSSPGLEAAEEVVAARREAIRVEFVGERHFSTILAMDVGSVLLKARVTELKRPAVLCDGANDVIWGARRDRGVDLEGDCDVGAY